MQPLASLLVPLRSAWDPALTAEGTLDPLGLTLVAERLAVHMIPGVRERQVDPRWLVAVCVGAWVDDGFEAERVAADGKSPPAMVYEWYLVEALIRAGLDESLAALPGRNKVRQAIERGEPVGASNYLKTPSVFGLQGVYRTLATSLGLIDADGLLLEAGAELLHIWAVECNLRGFISGTGPGVDFRHRLRALVEAGLAASHTRRMNPGDVERLTLNLSAYAMGPPVCDRIWLLLHEAGHQGERGWFLDRLSTAAAGQILAAQGEAGVMAWLLGQAPTADIRLWLEAVQAYERFGALIQQAFKSVLWAAQPHPVPLKILAKAPPISQASARVGPWYEASARALERLDLPGLVEAFEQRFASLAEATGPASRWLDRLISHHERIQAEKPPEGKAPWIERFADDRVLVRPRYRLSETPASGDSLRFVNQYRSHPLRRFCEYLGRAES